MTIKALPDGVLATLLFSERFIIYQEEVKSEKRIEKCFYLIVELIFFLLFFILKSIIDVRINALFSKNDDFIIQLNYCEVHPLN